MAAPRVTDVMCAGSVTGQAWYRTVTEELSVPSVVPGMPSTTRPPPPTYVGRAASVEQFW
ncbi:hypothetical protein RKE30_00770 [Streptomyces sp. Li-HN-5-11]|uniref:hypothetical protein n=1 Tax=Streptomyces sp. Li-HN-5-11 TaxID=3075432 RepID=UPI0028A96D66|nr:hypothetical protein [Streptomyces sp. Li-HN-5-11]WNM29040.1 hypothetical protein RKE30_00770 [Streptomyces sp. Li-HN-5-11]